MNILEFLKLLITTLAIFSERGKYDREKGRVQYIFKIIFMNEDYENGFLFQIKELLISYAFQASSSEGDDSSIT